MVANTMCRHDGVVRSIPTVLLATLIALVFESRAHAEDLLTAALNRDESVERGFIDARAEVWLPGQSTFGTNHRVSPAAAGVVGVRVLSREDHQLFVVATAMYSPQRLRAHLVEEHTSIFHGGIGVRYMPAMLCSRDHQACPFLEAELGMTWETAAAEPNHAAPQGKLSVTGGAGYRFRLARHFGLGVRADLAYLEEADQHQVGWVTVGGFMSVLF